MRFPCCSIGKRGYLQPPLASYGAGAKRMHGRCPPLTLLRALYVCLFQCSNSMPGDAGCATTGGCVQVAASAPFAHPVPSPATPRCHTTRQNVVGNPY